jgi:hypothetical protein
MVESVPVCNKTYKHSERYRLKKKYHLAFRRWLMGMSGGGDMGRYLGADVSFVREWINDRMVAGMTWNNYGAEWVIDHIVPIRMFDIKKDSELKMCWHYKNLMPLFKEDNLKKEGNVFYAFVLLSRIKGEDYFFNKLYDRILPEVDSMNKYIQTYIESIHD